MNKKTKKRSYRRKNKSYRRKNKKMIKGGEIPERYKILIRKDYDENGNKVAVYKDISMFETDPDNLPNIIKIEGDNLYLKDLDGKVIIINKNKNVIPYKNGFINLKCLFQMAPQQTKDLWIDEYKSFFDVNSGCSHY